MNYLFVTCLLRGEKDKVVYHIVHLDKGNVFIKDIIGLLNLYGNFNAKVVKIDLRSC